MVKRIKVEAILELIPEDGDEWDERTINSLIIDRIREWEDKLYISVKDVKWSVIYESKTFLVMVVDDEKINWITFADSEDEAINKVASDNLYTKEELIAEEHEPVR